MMTSGLVVEQGTPGISRSSLQVHQPDLLPPHQLVLFKFEPSAF